MPSLADRMRISKSRHILLPVKPSEITNLPAILDDIRPHIHPSCVIHLLALCPRFISGGDGDLAYARGFHHAAVLEATHAALTQAGETCWTANRLQTTVCEGGLSRIIAAAHDNLSDLILLATPGWSASQLARWKVAHLRRFSDCDVLVLPQPQRPAGGLPISLAAMTGMFPSRAALAPAF